MRLHALYVRPCVSSGVWNCLGPNLSIHPGKSLAKILYFAIDPGVLSDVEV